MEPNNSDQHHLNLQPEISQVLADVAGLEQLQVMQLKLIREIRKQLALLDKKS